MRAKNLLTFLFFNFYFACGQDVTEEAVSVIKVCSHCTCSEIPDVDGTHLVLNILCSELDKIDNLADLDKIEWPENPNGLKIAATFEGLGISTLGKLPPNSQLETLKFSGNAIKTYWPDPFREVPNLKKLSFYQNELTEITPDLFTNLEGLEDLDLSYNKISQFNPLDFKLLHRVRRFNLQSNVLKKIPFEALKPMVALEDLDLSKNGIYDVLLRRVNSDVLKNLKRLNLNGNRIRSISKESFPEDNVIELLDISNNIIEVIEEDSFLSCTSLRELNLAQNNITFTFALPPTLQIAILKINTLYHWPKFPAGITYIDLSYNRLSTLYDENNVHFDNLEVLNIGGNQLKEFYIEKKLPKLFILDLSYNLLSDVPKCFTSQTFPNLEELRLDGNPMESIYFKNIIALKTLYMNDMSKLSVVEDKAFSNVIGRNDDLFAKNCFSLFLSNCAGLKEIQEGAFDGTSLCALDISSNSLTGLSKTLLDWSTVDSVNLQNNPWHCSCDLQWVIDDLLPKLYKVNSRLLTELRCGSPRAFSGLRLIHWYNWTEQAMCGEDYTSHSTYMIEPSRSAGPQVTTLTLILGGCIIVCLCIATALAVYLIRSRRRHRVRQAALARRRQSAADNNGNGEQFTALNKA
ncbi:leucine-rich repeat-containing G-protein coupled receptor 5-like [Aricia agestis]|uniref:leucine-rich repeat-containing G-protein coupled receptor 5-like n=1 Tax=Aricia agestis TaxID=91739 RepID=UPI001C201CC4|nr:leucine-rich repeat-containing G-protein coupled receptor 5-like [Aricia agestis]